MENLKAISFRMEGGLEMYCPHCERDVVERLIFSGDRYVVICPICGHTLHVFNEVIR